MKVGPVSGDTVVMLVIVIAAAAGVWYVVGKVSDVASSASQYLKDAPGAIADNIAQTYHDTVEPYYDGRAYQDSPTASAIWQISEVQKNTNPMSPVNLVRWYWDAINWTAGQSSDLVTWATGK